MKKAENDHFERAKFNHLSIVILLQVMSKKIEILTV